MLFFLLFHSMCWFSLFLFSKASIYELLLMLVIMIVAIKPILRLGKRFYKVFFRLLQIRTAREEELPYLCLPEEIVLYIFSFLSTSDISKCARVCRQFRRISLDESLCTLSSFFLS